MWTSPVGLLVGPWLIRYLKPVLPFLEAFLLQGKGLRLSILQVVLALLNQPARPKTFRADARAAEE